MDKKLVALAKDVLQKVGNLPLPPEDFEELDDDTKVLMLHHMMKKTIGVLLQANELAEMVLAEAGTKFFVLPGKLEDKNGITWTSITDRLEGDIGLEAITKGVIKASAQINGETVTKEFSLRAWSQDRVVEGSDSDLDKKAKEEEKTA